MSRGSPKTSVQLAKSRLVVTNTEPRSYRSVRRPNSSSAPALGKGTNPTSSRMSRSSFRRQLDGQQVSQPGIGAIRNYARQIRLFHSGEQACRGTH